MKIRTRLTLLFTIITATILFAFAAVIYYSSKESRENEFYEKLKKEAITKANLFFNARVETRTMHRIYRNNRATLHEVEVAIYDSAFNLLYHDDVNLDIVKETPAMISEIYRDGEKLFYQDGWQVAGLRYEFENVRYILIATAYDQHGLSKLDNLLKNSVILFIIAVLIIYVAGRFFSKKAFGPVAEMTEKVHHITASNLDMRLTGNDSRDELSELANTFNQMLNRLESSFDAQKHFVSNISHEIRTPLAAIITELELSVNKDRTVDEYRQAIQHALNDARKLARLSGSLLDFAKASYDLSEIAFKPVRIDEVLLDAKLQVQQSNAEYDIDIHFEHDFEDEVLISVNGNEYLLKVAFSNLFENGCKFSPDHRCSASVSFSSRQLIIRFTDKGIGIPPDDLEHIFIPFYRGGNKKFADGNGIGLSLTRKIILLHQGDLTVSSVPSRGTAFTVFLPNIASL